MNGLAIAVDPPVGVDGYLTQMGIPSRLVTGMLLTHVHADHDSGAFQAIFQGSRITLYATCTILESFLRKYAALTVSLGERGEREREREGERERERERERRVTLLDLLVEKKC